MWSFKAYYTLRSSFEPMGNGHCRMGRDTPAIDYRLALRSNAL